MNWLQEQIRNTPAPDVILHLGAGLCHELPLWQHSGARRIVLVEPNPELLPELRRRTEGMEQVEIIEAAVAPEAGRGDLHLFNFPLLSSLRKPTALYQSLPGLQQVGRATVELLPIKPLLDQLDMDCEGENWLVIDTPGEEANVLQALEKSGCLHRFSRIFLTAGTEALYQDAQPAAEIAIGLESSGYRSVAAVDQTDADWPRYHLRLDRMALENERLRVELAQTHQKLEQTEKESTARANEIEKLNARIADFTKEQEKLESARQKLSEQAEARASELEQARAEWDKERQALEAQKNEETDGLNLRIAELEKERDELDSVRRELRQELESRTTQDKHNQDLKAIIGDMEKSLRREVHQTRIQLEHYISLNKYLDYGQLMPEFHGWTISPDLAIELLKMIEAESYDLVIEFGSGSSTVILAQAIQQQISKAPGIAEVIERLQPPESRHNGENTSKYTAEALSSARDVLPRIMAFEHSRTYHAETLAYLRRSGVDHLVDLVYSPLKDQMYGERTYLYYDCVSNLYRASQLLQDKTAKILVLVDGPPGSTNPYARYPALPNILENFASQELHVVLDDYSRAEEHEIVKMWESALSRRARTFTKKKLALEKGACILKIF